MKKSVNYWMIGGFEGETAIAEAARIAREAGFEAIEPCFGVGELAPDVALKNAPRIREQVEAAGVEIASLCTGYYWDIPLSSPDALVREQAVEFTRSYIQCAKALGAEVVLVLPGIVSVPWEDEVRPLVSAKEAWNLAGESLRSLIPAAEENRVVLGLENVWSHFLTGPFEMAAFIDSFNSPMVKAYFDTGNAILFGHPQHWIEVLADRIARVHVKNFRRSAGGGTLAGFTSELEEGDVSWPEVLRALRAANYNGPLTAEVTAGEGPDLGQVQSVSRAMDRLLLFHA